MSGVDNITRRIESPIPGCVSPGILDAFRLCSKQSNITSDYAFCFFFWKKKSTLFQLKVSYSAFCY
jgi:hypothetical protein